ncbi:MAG: site-specific integrase, partial [Methylosarcina sp.]
MATFTQFKTGWRAQIRRKGHKSIARTFNTKAEAERWALSIEASMGVGTYVDNRESLSTTLAECLKRYASEVVPHKKGAKRELYRIKFWQDESLATKGIGTIKQMDIAKWRDERIAAGYSGSTVKKDLALLSHVFTIAAKEWGFPLTNPVLMIRKPKSGLARDRRLHAGEMELLFEYAGSQEMRSLIILAIETAMRRGELIGLRRSWIKGRVAYLPDTKNGSPRAVPLSTRALEALSALPIRIDGKVFEHTEDAYTRIFARICKKAGIEDLRLHDLRHEATSRLFEKGLDVMQVKSITGHKSLQMLAR